MKILVQRHDKFIWKKVKNFFTGIASVALFNTIFTLIKPYIPHITYWKVPKHAMRVLKKLVRKKCQHH